MTLACDPDPAPGGEAAPATPVRDTSPVRDTALEVALREAAATLDGVVGTAALHLQRNLHASLDGDRPFFLASVYKLPIAYAALVGGGLGPTDSVTVEPTDRAPGETPFSPGVTVPLTALVEQSLANSDNTASDVLLRLAGGPAEATRRVQALGVRGIRIDRAMGEVFAAWRAPGEGARAAFLEDVRDTGTAAELVALLAALHRGDGLEPWTRALLLASLEAASTGPNRIRAGVPAGTTVAHKTGTLGPLTHDVGLITLPGEPGARGPGRARPVRLAAGRPREAHRGGGPGRLGAVRRRPGGLGGLKRRGQNSTSSRTIRSMAARTSAAEAPAPLTRMLKDSSRPVRVVM